MGQCEYLGPRRHRGELLWDVGGPGGMCTTPAIGSVRWSPHLGDSYQWHPCCLRHILLVRTLTGYVRPIGILTDGKWELNDQALAAIIMEP